MRIVNIQCLIYNLWNVIFVGSNLSLFIILPFAYFFHEASSNGIIQRCYEATLVLILVSIMITGVIYLGHSISELDTEYSQFSYSLITTVGSVVVLVATPFGFTELITAGFNLKIPFTSKEAAQQRIQALDFEIQVLTLQLSSTHQRIKDEELLNQIKNLKVERENAIKASNQHPLRNALSLLATLLNLIFSAYIMMRVLMQLMIDLFGQMSDDRLYNFLMFEAGPHSKSDLRLLHSLIELSVIFYLMISAFYGFYRISWTSFLRPQLFNTPFHKILLNVAIVLMMSSSFPIVARTLGLTSFSLMGYYNETQTVKNWVFHALFKIVFIFATSQRYSKLFPFNIKSHGKYNTK